MEIFTESSSSKQRAIDSELDGPIDGQLQIHRYANGDVALVVSKGGKLHRIDVESDNIISEGPTSVESIEGKVKNPNTGNSMFIGEIALGNCCTVDTNGCYSNVITKMTNESVNDSELQRKTEAIAIDRLFTELGDFSKDRALLKKMESDRKLREKYKPEDVRTWMKAHLNEANTLIEKYSRSEIMKDVLGFDIDQTNDQGENVYIDQADFNCAVRRRFFPEKITDSIIDNREFVRNKIRKMYQG